MKDIKNFDDLKSLAILNANNIYKILKWNETKDIKVLQLPNDMIPFFNDNNLFNIDACEAYDYTKLNFKKKELEKIKKFVIEHEHRLIFELPNGTNLCNSEKNILNQSVNNIESYSKLLKLICPKNGNIIINYYNENENLWKNNYENISEENKKFIVLKNDKLNNPKVCIPITTNIIYNNNWKNYLISWENKKTFIIFIL